MKPSSNCITKMSYLISTLVIHEFLLHTVWFFASISLPISTFTEEVYLSPRSNSWARLVPHLTNHVLTATTVSVVSANNIETRKMNAITERKNNRFAPKYHKSTPLSSTAKRVPKHLFHVHQNLHLQFLPCTPQVVKDCCW